MKNNIYETFRIQVLSTFITQLIGLFLALSTSIIIARWLGPEGKGILKMTLLVPGMMVIFLNSGIGVANVYFAASKRMNIKILTCNSIVYSFLATVFGVFIIGFFLISGTFQLILPKVPIGLFLIAMIGFPIGILNGYFLSILQGLQLIIKINLIHIAQGFLLLTMTFILVAILKIDILGALIANLCVSIFILLTLSIIIYKKGGVLIPKRNFLAMRTTLSFGLKGHIGNVLQFLNYRLDIFILNYFLGPLAVGIYSVSVGIAELLWYFPNAVGFVIFPKAASTKQEIMNNFTPRIFKITLELTTLGSIFLILFGKQLIIYLYSSPFLPSYIPMLILLPGVVLMGGAKVLTNEIAGRGYPHYNSINSGFSLILTIFLDIILIPKYHIFGAALASSISYSISFILAIGFYLIVSRKGKELIETKIINEGLNVSTPQY